jgi:hypothetical protein
MPRLASAPAELLADHFVNYLFSEYQGTRHVRRVAAWVGLIVLGIQRASGNQWRIPRNRQLMFEYRGRTFKAKYNHGAGPRGGVDVVEVLAGRGSPEGGTVTSITNLRQAEEFYNNAPMLLQDFISQGH